MSFIELGDEFANTKEPEIAPEGKEFDLKVEAVDEERDENKKKHNIRLRVSIEHGRDEGPFQPIFHYIAVPNKKWDEAADKEKNRDKGETSRFKMLMLKRMLHYFNLPWENVTGFAPNDFVGQTARGGLGQQEYEGRVSNKLIVPNLPQT